MDNSNLLKIQYPNLIKDWDEEKNEGVDKNKITIGSSRLLINWKCHKCGYEWKQKVINRLKFKTECKVCTKKENLLRVSNADLFDEIDFEKNENVEFDTLTKGMSKKIWWKCKNGHSWFQNIDTRVKLGASCKECKNVSNSIVNTHPDLISEWDYNKNGTLMPENVTRGSNKKVWWICKNCNNSFQCVIDKRTRGTNCGKCRKRIQPKIPLTQNYNHLLSEWDWEKNKELSPDIISEGSNVMVNWKCKYGHEFQMEPYYRTKQSLGCPYCRGLKVGKSNSLFTLRPELCKEWDFVKNSDISSENLTVRSNKVVWWKCNNGHSWESSIDNRSKKKGTTCPMCSGRTASKATNIEVLYPKIMEEWDWEKNIESPSTLRPGSSKKVWWKCLKNNSHSWCTTVYSRTSSDIGCPYCYGRYTMREDSVGNLNPEFMKEWDRERNKGLDPFSLSPKSEKNVWWTCLNDNKHFWRTKISHRTAGTNCPYCSFSNLIVKRYIGNQKMDLSDQINLYFLILYSKEEMFYKIGITKNTVEERYRDLFNKTGYKIVKVNIVKDALFKIVNEEQTIHRKVSRKLDTNLIKYKPIRYFGGFSECYEVPSELKKYEVKLKIRYDEYDPIITIYRI
jgi:hypothetical protein